MCFSQFSHQLLIIHHVRLGFPDLFDSSSSSPSRKVFFRLPLRGQCDWNWASSGARWVDLSNFGLKAWHINWKGLSWTPPARTHTQWLKNNLHRLMSIRNDKKGVKFSRHVKLVSLALFLLFSVTVQRKGTARWSVKDEARKAQKKQTKLFLVDNKQSSRVSGWEETLRRRAKSARKTHKSEHSWCQQLPCFFLVISEIESSQSRRLIKLLFRFFFSYSHEHRQHFFFQLSGGFWSKHFTTLT